MNETRVNPLEANDRARALNNFVEAVAAGSPAQFPEQLEHAKIDDDGYFHRETSLRPAGYTTHGLRYYPNLSVIDEMNEHERDEKIVDFVRYTTTEDGVTTVEAVSRDNLDDADGVFIRTRRQVELRNQEDIKQRDTQAHITTYNSQKFSDSRVI